MSDTPVGPPSPYIIREFNDRGTLWLLEDPAFLQDFMCILGRAGRLQRIVACIRLFPSSSTLDESDGIKRSRWRT